jgi:hypothetical protein
MHDKSIFGAKRGCVEAYLKSQPIGLVDWLRSGRDMKVADIAKFNVHGIGIAIKRKRMPDGSEAETGEICIQVAVLRKFETPEEVAKLGATLIPKSIEFAGESVLTDVIEADPLIIERHNDEAANGESAAILRPIRPGCSISRDRFFGTLGGFCRSTRVDEQDKVFLLSCRHVLARFDEAGGRDTADIPIFQPGGQAADAGQLIATRTDRFVDHGLPLTAPPRFAGDAAIAQLKTGLEFNPDNLGIGRPAGVMDLMQLSIQRLLRADKYVKFGRTTGLTTGRLNVVRRDMLSPVDGRQVLMNDQFVVRREAGSRTPMSDPGDSGAMMFHHETRMAVGLVIGAPTGPKNDIESVISPLTPVLKELEVELIV